MNEVDEVDEVLARRELRSATETILDRAKEDWIMRADRVEEFAEAVMAYLDAEDAQDLEDEARASVEGA